MYYLLDENEIEKLNEISDITGTDYEITGKFVPVDSMMAALEDLLVQYHKKEEELEDLNENVQDNYRPIPVREQVGVSDRDFY